jgi:hypothetical protein
VNAPFPNEPKTNGTRRTQSAQKVQQEGCQSHVPLVPRRWSSRLLYPSKQLIHLLSPWHGQYR